MHHFLLDTEKKIKEKLEMLQSLEDIQVFTKILDEGKINSDMNELDSNYLKLNTEIEPLPKDSELRKMDNGHNKSKYGMHLLLKRKKLPYWMEK